VFEFVLFTGLRGDVFKKLDIAEPQFLILAKIEKVDNDGNQNREKQIQKFRMLETHWSGSEFKWPNVVNLKGNWMLDTGYCLPDCVSQAGILVSGYCRLPTADCRLLTADCRLKTVDCQLPIVD